MLSLHLILSAAVLLIMTTFASAQQNLTVVPLIVVEDYDSYGEPVAQQLPAAIQPFFEIATSTSSPGSASFGVRLYGTTSAAFTLVQSGTTSAFTVVPTNNASLCTPNASLAVTLSTTTVAQCNYSASWTTPFTGSVAVQLLESISAFTRWSVLNFVTSQSGGVTGDPQFVGVRGQTFQVHGLAGAVYNLITGRRLQVNARFVFLSQGECPESDGVVEDACWSHAGSYVGQMSFQAVVEGAVHSALVVAGAARTGFARVEVDGAVLGIGDAVSSGSSARAAFSVARTSSHHVHVHTEQFDFELASSDRFVNHKVRVNVPLSELSTHGLLGQTHARASKESHRRSRHFEGDVDDYAEADRDIFGSKFTYNRFKGAAAERG